MRQQIGGMLNVPLLYFSTKTYVVGAPKNYFNLMVLLSFKLMDKEKIIILH